MNWTIDKPTVEGQYWVRIREGEFYPDYHIVCLGVSISSTGKVTLDTNADGYECEADWYAENVSHWYGPIKPPLFDEGL